MSSYLPAISNIQEWAAIFTDVNLWAPIVRLIFKKHNMACDNIQAGYPGSHAVFVVDKHYVIKIASPLWLQDFERELTVLTMLQDLPIPVPKVIVNGQWVDKKVWSYFIMPYIDGLPIREMGPRLTNNERHQVAVQLASLVHQFHVAVVLEKKHGEWSELVKHQKYTLKERLLTLSLREELHNQLVDLVLEWDFSCSSDDIKLLNGDLTEDHLLLLTNERGCQISGIIDWADALYGPVEYDWVALWFGAFNQDAGMMRKFMQQYNGRQQLEEDWKKKMLVYTVMHRFGVQIIEEVLEHKAEHVQDLAQLQELLWPI